jgi:hypothetical protein
MATSAKTILLALAAAALIAAPGAQAAELLSHPVSVERTKVVQVDWTAPDAPEAPAVVVERRHGLDWVTEGTGDVLVSNADADAWTARWRSTYYSPSGTYRIRVEGSDYSLTSKEFSVRPCDCVIPHPVRAKWSDGRFRLRMTAEYAARSIPGFAALPAAVTTGRPLVRVFRDGRRVGSARLRYKGGAFRGSWTGPRGPRNSMVFQLVSLRDVFGNG